MIFSLKCIGRFRTPSVDGLILENYSSANHLDGDILGFKKDFLQRILIAYGNTEDQLI